MASKRSAVSGDTAVITPATPAEAPQPPEPDMMSVVAQPTDAMVMTLEQKAPTAIPMEIDSVPTKSFSETAADANGTKRTRRRTRKSVGDQADVVGIV